MGKSCRVTLWMLHAQGRMNDTLSLYKEEGRWTNQGGGQIFFLGGDVGGKFFLSEY